jgi:hypothetical protein
VRELPFFIHLNKNGGYTMRDVLVRNHPPGDLLDVMVRGRRSVDGRAKTVESADDDVVHCVAEIRRRQHELACVAANLPFGIDRFLERPVAYFTVLREPVSRGLSYWFFAYNNRDNHPMWSILESYDFDLDRIFAAGAGYHLTNDQVRMVAGIGTPEPGADDLARAKDLIEERYTLVGALERFDPCLRALARRFGWRDIAYERRNVGEKTKRSILPRGFEGRLREANEWDARLHEWLVRDYLPRRLEALAAAA